MAHQSHKSKTHKAKTDFRPSDLEIEMAEIIIRSLYDRWPEEEDWFSLGKFADLNLYIRNGAKKAAIYPVQNKQTVSCVWYRLYIQEAIGEYPP